MRFASTFVLAFLSFPVLLLAQQTPSTAERDPQAMAIIANAIQALGGSASVAQDQTIQTSGSIAPATGSSQTPGTFVWKDQITASGFEFRSEFQSSTGTAVFLSGHGKPAQTAGGATVSLQPHVAEAVLPYHLPSVLLAAELANASYNFTVIGRTTLNGRTAVQLHASLDTDDVTKAISPQDWYFDAQTSIPLRVEYRVPSVDNALVFQKTAVDFGDFRSVGALLLPFKLSVSINGNPQTQITVASFTLNPSLSPTDFDPAVAAGAR